MTTSYHDRAHEAESTDGPDGLYSPSASLLQHALDEAPVGIWIADDCSRTVFVNQHLATMLGYTVEEMRGRSLFAFMDDARNSGILEHRLDQRQRTLDAKFIRKDGAACWASVALCPATDDVGRYSGTVAILTDITERKRAEELQKVDHERGVTETRIQAARAQEELIRQERLRALGQLASGVAHDFNNALAVIMGLTDLLFLRPELLDDRAKLLSYLKQIQTSASDAAKIVQGLREFYRPREEARVLLNLNQIVEETIQLTAPKWRVDAEANGRAIHVRTQLTALPEILGDPAELREALTNLIFNAVDALPMGGTITIRTVVDQGAVLIEVSDDGVGMSDDVRERCLEPFFTTKGERGSGLGLSMVLGAVQRHDGSVAIESAPANGTTIRIRIPIAQCPGLEPSHGGEERAGKPPAARVLAVDDDPDVLEVVRQFLGMDGHRVATASGGQEALDRLRSDHFDLVITDLAMPEMNGGELATAIKLQTPNVPIILLTGFADTMEVQGDHPKAVDLVLGKPITQAALRKAIDLVLHKPEAVDIRIPRMK